ncbi:GPP34 family phosphoprotein [Actinoplanes oblitus]|uniref:GPP34 family phosphoprotein n=1 Tax=Actinoplanes oblitus TaxID=3040509 RepID=A0ABY8WJC9_9ACTN|nr:GPP34 family phosphoprotein [Actinoplanes oblitus]WIM96613.1 GPP34 family phosphoprotein [Actinoplanes oblitus]
MTLLEEFTVLAHDQLGRRVIDSTRIDHGLGGALLLELVLAERVDVVDGRVVVRGAGSTGDALLDEALDRIATDRRARKPVDWVKRFAKGTQRRVLDRLVAAGVLRVERSTVLGVFPRTRYPSAYATAPAALEQLRTAILAGGQVPPRTAALGALVAATELDKKLFRDLDRKMVRTRLKEISQGDWAAAAVRKAIQDVQAAITAGVVAATTAAAISS